MDRDPPDHRRRDADGAVLSRLLRPVPILVAWTLLVWVSRLRNVLTDDELSSAGTAWRVVVVVVFVGLAVLVVLDRRALAPLVLWTIGFWLVRGIGIIVDDHDLGFTVVHTALMIVSIGIAAWAWVARAR